MAAAAACRGPTPTPAKPSGNAADAPLTKARPTEVQSAATDSRVRTAGPGPTAPPLQQIVPIASPFAAGTVVVGPVSHQVPIVLFPDESAEVRAGVAAALTRLGHRVAPPLEVSRIERAAAHGQLMLEEFQSCRSPLSPAEVAQRYFGALPSAEAELSCVDDCVASVTVSAPVIPDDGKYLNAYTSLEFTRGHDPRAWVKATDSLKDRHVGVGGLGSGGLFSSHPPPIMFTSVNSIGPWAATPDRSTFRALGDSVHGCAQTNRHTRFDWLIQLSVAASGKVLRCLATSEHAQALPINAACLCSMIEALRFSSGRSGRRVRATARDSGSFVDKDAGFDMLQPGTEPWVRRLHESTVLADCRATVPNTAGLSATAVLDLEPDGSITNVEIVGDITTMPAMQWASCLVRSIPTVRLPCRPPGIDQLQVGVTTAK